MFSFLLLCLLWFCEMYSRQREMMAWGDEKDRSPSSERVRQYSEFDLDPGKWTPPCTGHFKVEQMSYVRSAAALASLWLPEHFSGLRAKLSMEICCKWFVLMWLRRLWIQQSRKDPYSCHVRSVKKMWIQVFQPLSPYNIINTNIIWQRFALGFWYLWHWANFPPGFAHCGHSSWASITKHGQRGLSSSRYSAMCLAAVY